MFSSKQTLIVPEIHGEQSANTANLGQIPNLELESGTTGAPGHIVQQDGDKFDLQFGRMALGSSTTFAGTVSSSATFPAGHVIQAVDNPITPAVQSSSSNYYSNNTYATIILKKANSKIAFFPASSPQINDGGDAHYTVHWRYRDPGGTWSSYADTLRIRLKLHGHASWRELPLGGVGLHSPNQPAGKELEYRVYYEVNAGSVYDADAWGYGTQMHNMTLMEIAA